MRLRAIALSGDMTLVVIHHRHTRRSRVGETAVSAPKGPSTARPPTSQRLLPRNCGRFVIAEKAVFTPREG